MSGPGGCLVVWSQGGVSGPGGYLADPLTRPGTPLGTRPGTLPGDQTRYPPKTRPGTPLLTESQTGVKILPWPNFVAAGENGFNYNMQN